MGKHKKDPYKCENFGSYSKVHVTNGSFLISNEDLEFVLNDRWNLRIRKNKIVAVQRGLMIKGFSYSIGLHREICKRIGLNIDGFEIDHIDCDPANNIRENLRVVTSSQNKMNKDKTFLNKSGYKGVHFNKRANKFTAQIAINRKQIHLGLFLTAEEAAAAYDRASIIYHKEYGRLNFPKVIYTKPWGHSQIVPATNQ